MRSTSDASYRTGEAAPIRAARGKRRVAPSAVLPRLATAWRSPLPTLLLLAASAPALLPLAAPGYLQGADHLDPPWLAFLLKRAWLEGVIFPQWVPDAFYRYGHPTFSLYSPIGFYQVLLLESLTPLGLVDASKAAFGANLLLAGWGAYFLSREIVGHRGAALLAGVLYMYAPSTLAGLYLRSNLEEAASLALLPFTLAVFVRLSRRPSPSLVGAGAALVAALILTHDLTCLVAVGMVAAILAVHLWVRRDPRVPMLATLALALGLAMASPVWLPTVGEIRATHTEVSSGAVPLGLHLVDPLGAVDQSLQGRHGLEPYRLTRYGPVDLHPAYPYGPPPYKPSLLQGLLLVVSAVALATWRPPLRHSGAPGGSYRGDTGPSGGAERQISRTLGAPAVSSGAPKPSSHSHQAAAGAGESLASLFLLALTFLFLSTTWSHPIWEAVPVAVQLPGWSNGPLGLCLAVVGSWALLSLARSRAVGLLSVAGVAAVASSVWMLPTNLAPFAGGTELTRDGFLQFERREEAGFESWPLARFLPSTIRWEPDTMDRGDLAALYDRSFPPEEWVAETALLPPGSKALVIATRRGAQWMQAVVHAEETTRVAFHTVAFHGWAAYLDGRRVPIEPTSWQTYQQGPRGVPARAALGVAQVLVPEGVHQVSLVLESTPLRRASGLLGALGILGVGMAFVVDLSRRRGLARGGWALSRLGMGLVVGVGIGYLVHQEISSPAMPDWVRNRVVVDLVKRARQERLRVVVPEGAKPADHVHVKRFTIAGDTRPVLFMQPTASASLRMWLPAGARLEFAMGVDPAVWGRSGDGVEFQVEVRDGGVPALLHSAYLDPKRDPSHQQWVEASVDLNRFARREVELVLRTHSGGSPEFDWAGWATPKVVVHPAPG